MTAGALIPDPRGLLQPVERHVHQQRADHTALGSSLLGRREHPVLNHPGPQPAGDQIPGGNDPSAANSREWSIVSNAADKSASTIHTRLLPPFRVVKSEAIASAQPRPGRNPYDFGSNRASHSGSSALRTPA